MRIGETGRVEREKEKEQRRVREGFENRTGCTFNVTHDDVFVALGQHVPLKQARKILVSPQSRRRDE